MKTNCFNKYLGGVLIFLLSATFELHAQFGGGGGGGGGRFGGGGGFGGGGFGGFGGGGFGGGAVNRGTTTSGSSQYNNNGTVGTANISVDPVTHNLVIVADAETMAQIREVIASLDAPEPQVLIKAAFIEVNDNTALDLGVQGTYTGLSPKFSTITGYMTNFAVANSSGLVSSVNQANSSDTIVPTGITPINQTLNVNNNFNLPQTLTGATGNGGLYQFMGSDFNATLQAIATAGKAQVLSRPSILARDGQMAEIVVGQSIYLPSSVSLTAVGGTSTTVPEINGSYQNVGIQLDVTPFIGQNGLVQMILEPQITSIDTSSPGQVIQGGSLFTSAVYAPNLNKRSANTVVVTPDGQTVVIGGLISNDKSSSESKIPLLGDIPVLGNFFKFSSHADQKDELLIFLTPHVIQMPSQLAAMSAHETTQTPLITNTNSISEQELDRFLDRMPVKK
jgi:general secretion pathway protein D